MQDLLDIHHMTTAIVAKVDIIPINVLLGSV